MIRTFTLRRLLFYVAVLCAVCGIAVNFPQQFLTIGFAVGSFVPALLSCYWLSQFAKQRVLIVVYGLVGAGCGYMLAPTIVGNPPLTLWDQFIQDFPGRAGFATGGAIVVCGMALVFVSRRKSTD